MRYYFIGLVVLLISLIGLRFWLLNCFVDECENDGGSVIETSAGDAICIPSDELETPRRHHLHHHTHHRR